MDEVMEMKLDVRPELVALCGRIDAVAKEEDFSTIRWAFFPEEVTPLVRQGAVGFTDYRAYDVSVWETSDGSFMSFAYWREVDKYEAETWETHKCADDFEEVE